MNLELMGALNELEKERGISKEVLLEAIEAAIVSAYKRHYGSAQNLRVEVDPRSGRIRVFALKTVVDEVTDPQTQTALEEARRLNPSYQPDDVVEYEVTPKDFGRIAAQTAKQVVIQRIREAERSLVFEEFSNRQGDVMTGIVQRIEYRNVFVDLGKVEAVLPPQEQIPGEPYRHNQRMKVYVAEVRRTPKGPQVIVSRTHPGLLRRLFELEVPEIHEGIVELKAVAREPGARSKMAVWSNDDRVDAVGACVGPRGMRVQSVVRELRGEKIDIIKWDPDPTVFVANALQPARVLAVYVDEEEKTARVVVPENMLSLAIGKEGQNARLAARLTGWKIDIKSELQWAEVKEEVARRRAERAAQLAAQAQLAEAVDSDEEALPAVTGGELVAQGALPGADGAGVTGSGVPEDGEVLAGEAGVQGAGDRIPGEEQPEEVLPEDLEEEQDYGDEALLPAVEAEEEEPRERPAAKAKRRKAPKRALVEDLIEEETEPLPTLFGEEEEAPEEVPAEYLDKGELAVPLASVTRLAEPDLAGPPSKPAPAQAKGAGRADAAQKASPAAAGKTASKASQKAAPAETEPVATKPARGAAAAPAASAASGAGAAKPQPKSAKAGKPKENGQKSKVLKSFAELSLEDFGFRGGRR